MQKKRGEESCLFSRILVFVLSLPSLPRASFVMHTASPPPLFSLSLCQHRCASPTLCLSLYSPPSPNSISFSQPSLLSIHVFSITPVLSPSLYLSSSPQLSSSIPFPSYVNNPPFLLLSWSLIPSPLLLSLHTSFTTIIPALASSHLSLSVIIFFSSLPLYYYLYVILPLSWCHYIYLLCFLSYPARLLGCFYSTHSPAIFITQRTNTTTSLYLSFSLSSLAFSKC